MADVKARLILDTKDAETQVKSIERTISNLSKKKLKLEAEQGKLNKTKKDIEDIDRKINDINGKRLNLQASETAYQKVVSDIDKIDRKIKELSAKRLEIKADGGDTKEITAEIDRLKAQKIRLTVQRDGLKQAHAEFVALEKELTKLQNKRVDLQARLDNGENVASELNAVEKEITDLDGKRAELLVELEGANQVLSTIKNIKQAQASIKNFGVGLENVGRSMSNIFKIGSNTPIGKFAHFLTQGIGYSALYRGATAGINGMNEALSGSIDRFDAIRRGTNVLKNLRDSEGLAYDDSQIDRLINGVHKAGEEYEGLADRILGLPTTLDEALGHTTDLVSVTKDMDYSADLYTALNDSVLSFGGNAENVQRVMNQFIVSLGKGKVDGRAFRAMLQNHMTPALNEVAKMLGKANAGELQEALSNGEISARQFSDALIDLDKNGSEGMNALRETVFDSVDTISGSFQVLKARLTAGFTDVFTAINDTIGEIFGDDRNIIYWIKQMGTSFRESMQGVAQWVREHKDEIQQGLDLISSKLKEVWETVKQFNFMSFLEGIMDFKPVFDAVVGVLKEIGEAFKGVMEFIGGGDFSKGLGRFVTGWYLLAGAFMGAGKALQALAIPLGTVIGLLQSMGKIGAIKGGFLGGLFKGFKPDVAGAGGQASAFGTENLLASLKRTGANLANVLALALEIVVLAKAIGYASEQLPEDLGGFAKKMVALTGAVVVMEGLIQGVGKIANKGLDAQLFGSLSLLFMGGDLIVLAKGIAELDKALPDNVGFDFVKKMGALFGIVVEIASLATAIGALETVATGGLGILVGGAGLATLSAIGLVLQDIGKGLAELDKANLDSVSVTTTMNNLERVITKVTELSVTGFGEKAGDYEGLGTAFTKLQSVAKSIAEIAKVEIPDTAETNITKIGNCIKAIEENLSGDTWSLNQQAISQTQLAIDSLKKLPQGLRDFTVEMDEVTKEISETKIGNQASKISQVVGTMSANMHMSGFKDFVKSADVSNVVDALRNLQTLVDEFLNFGDRFAENAFSATRLTGNIQELGKGLQAFKDEDLGNKLKYLTDFSSKLTSASQQLTNLKNIVTSIEEFSKMFSQGDRDFLDSKIIEESVAKLRTALEKINGLVGTDSPLTAIADTETYDFSTVSSQLTLLNEIVTTLNSIGDTQVDLAKIETISTHIGTAIRSLKNAFGTGGSVGGSLGGVNAIQNMVNQISSAIGTLNGLDFTPTGTNYGQQIIDGFNSADLAGGFSSAVDGAKSALEGKASAFTSVGRAYANAIKQGFNSAINGLGSGILVQALSLITSGTGAFRTAGISLGNALLSGMQSALDRGVTVQVTASTSASVGGLIGGGISVGNRTISAFDTIASIFRANGGNVGYYAKGGMLAYFEPKGTDIVPAMLTPGEFVIQRKAVKTYGSDFFKHLNNMDIQRAFQSITNRDMSTQSNQVAYTTVNNNSVYNDNRSVSVNGTSERSQRLKAGRFLRGLV